MREDSEHQVTATKPSVSAVLLVQYKKNNNWERGWEQRSELAGKWKGLSRIAALGLTEDTNAVWVPLSRNMKYPGKKWSGK